MIKLITLAMLLSIALMVASLTGCATGKVITDNDSNVNDGGSYKLCDDPINRGTMICP